MKPCRSAVAAAALAFCLGSSCGGDGCRAPVDRGGAEGSGEIVANGSGVVPPSGRADGRGTEAATPGRRHVMRVDERELNRPEAVSDGVGGPGDTQRTRASLHLDRSGLEFTRALAACDPDHEIVASGGTMTVTLREAMESAEHARVDVELTFKDSRLTDAERACMRSRVSDVHFPAHRDVRGLASDRWTVSSASGTVYVVTYVFEPEESDKLE